MKHARYYWRMLAEGHLLRRLFGEMLRRIWALPVREDSQATADRPARHRTATEEGQSVDRSSGCS